MIRLGALAGVALAMAGMAGAWLLQAPALPREAQAVRPVWAEVAWPFASDPWGRGKAFRCAAADCGAEVSVYIRPKLGFCNCTTGIADDEDLDRMGDLALVGGETAPLGAGRAVAIGWMTGRARAYALATDRSALSVAFNDRCDMVAATVVVPRDASTAIEPHVLAFLNSETVLDWTRRVLGI